MRTLAANWEAEVAGVRNDNRALRSSLQGAQAQQRQAEERRVHSSRRLRRPTT
jgi:hypothetical protein